MFPCELALIAGLVCASIAVCLLLKSGLGVSVISSVALSLYYSAPVLSFGTWNIIFQIGVLLLLIAILKKVNISYFVSLGVGVVFGILLDVMKPIVFSLPDETWLIPVYVAASMLIISVGITFFMKCQMPLLPCDIFVRNIVIEKHLPLGRTKTIFDISCLIFAIAVSLIFAGAIRDIGIGTVISAVFTGTLVALVSKGISKVFDFRPVTGIAKRSLNGSLDATKDSHANAEQIAKVVKVKNNE